MNRPITLPEMLDAREHRALRQKQLLARYSMPMVCFTMNIAGPVKNSRLIRKGFEAGKLYLSERLDSLHISCSHYEEIDEATGNEACWLIDADPLLIKKITCDIEDGSGIGRLFDMDVLRPDGTKIDRAELGLPPRLCLICGGPARECARSRTHTVEQLQARIRELLTQTLEEEDSILVARLASQALLYEVCTTPKPGLVDREGNGSHKDMDIFTFMNSASALWPYFQACTRIGMQTARLSPEKTFQQIRFRGQRAEADMLAATRGINTHKGAIFSLGILCAALGRLPKELWKMPDAVLKECASMTAGLVAADFAGLTRENAVTTGQKLYLQHRITGVRGQMEAGLPAVRDVGLPALKEGLARGLDLNRAGCGALLALITAAVDTNLIARSSLTTQQETVSQLKELLLHDPYPDLPTLRHLDSRFIEKNLSPGGSADLLAVCYLLYFLENEV